MVAKLSLVASLAVVEDPRVDRTKAHDLQDILVLAVLAVLCGADGSEDIELFADGWRLFLAIKDNHLTLHKSMSEHFDQIHEEGCIGTGVQHHRSRPRGMLGDSILRRTRGSWSDQSPNAASWRAELNRPTAGAGWLTCEPSGRKPRAISFNPQPTARNLTRPARMICMGPKRVFASTGREHVGEQPIDRQNCATVACARSCFESVGLAFHAARYLFLNRFHQATVTRRRDHCRSSLDQNSNQSKA